MTNAINVIRIMWLEGVLGSGIKNGTYFAQFCAALFHVSLQTCKNSFELTEIGQYKISSQELKGYQLQHNLALVASLAGKAAMRISMLKQK